MINRAIPVILILAAIGIVVLYVNPTYKNKILPLKENISQSNAALAAAQDFHDKEAQLATERAAISEESIAKISKFLPDGVDNVQLILDLNALATRSGVTLSNFNIKQNLERKDSVNEFGQAQGTNVQSLDLSVTASGTYSAFRTFLAGIERSLRPLDVMEIIVTNSESGVYSYDMTIRIYWLH